MLFFRTNPIKDKCIAVEKHAGCVIGIETEDALNILKKNPPGSYILNLNKYFFSFYDLMFLDANNELVKIKIGVKEGISKSNESISHYICGVNRTPQSTDDLDQIIGKILSEHGITATPIPVDLPKDKFIKQEEKPELLKPEQLSSTQIALTKDSVTALVHQDGSVQWSPKVGILYILRRDKFETAMQDYLIDTYKPVGIKDKKMVLKSDGIFKCTTVMIHDTTKNSWFMTHISPQSLRKALGIETPGAGLTQFAFNVAADEFFSKPIFANFKSDCYADKTIGIENDSKLEVLVVVNHGVAAKIVSGLKGLLESTFPDQIEKYNVIVTQVLKQEIPGTKGDTISGYNVALNVESNELTVASGDTRAKYQEVYSDPFKAKSPDAPGEVPSSTTGLSK